MNARDSDFCRWDGGDLLLEVRVIPSADHDAVAGIRAGRLLVRLQAPAAEGRANAALERLLAKLCGVRRGAVRIEKGETARDKTVRIERPGTLPTLAQN